MNAACPVGEEIDRRKKDESQEKLSRAGFLERPDQAVHTTNCRNGMPMGGIGAGKIELDADGVFTAITINNNFDVPIYKTGGSFFAVRWDGGARLLQKKHDNPYPFTTIREIDFSGAFPCAKLDYRDEDIPVRLSLQAFSPLIPHDIKNSVLPCAVFSFTAENPGTGDTEISLLFSWENMIGTGGSMVRKSSNPDVPTISIMNTWNPGFTWSNRTGTFQRVLSGREIGFYARSDQLNPTSFGHYALLAGEASEVTCRDSWNIFTEGASLWETFADTGALARMGADQVGQEDEAYLAAALCQKLVIKAGEKATAVFVLAWYMPHLIDARGEDMGTYYTNFFGDASEIAHYVMDNRVSLRDRTLELQELLGQSSLPAWLRGKLINDMFPIYTCSWFAKAGHFSINEAPTGMMGCLGTMDQRLASNVIYTNFFRELDRIELALFARCQGQDGSISHDLGSGVFDLTERGGTWSDLASSFVLQVYKHYLYTGDQAFFTAMYPHIRRAVAWQLSIDHDQNGIPDVGAGNGTTYDTYHWFGTSAFVASLWLAELMACRRMAELRGDETFASQCEALLEKARKSMIDELWTDRHACGGYFKSYHDASGAHATENCFIAQLAGQWAAHLLDLGDILPRPMLEEAIRTITRQNVLLDGLPGLNDETSPEGVFDWYGYTFVQYDEVYYGCLAIYNGLVAEGLACFRKVYDMNRHAPWNVPLTQHADGRINGLPYYMTNPASFFLLEALSGFVPDVANQMLKIAPNIGREQHLSLPLFSPVIWIWLEYGQQPDGRDCRIKVLKVIDREAVHFTRFVTEVPSGRSVQAVMVDGVQVPFMISGRRLQLDIQWRLKPGSERHLAITLA